MINSTERQEKIKGLQGEIRHAKKFYGSGNVWLFDVENEANDRLLTEQEKIDELNVQVAECTRQLESLKYTWIYCKSCKQLKPPAKFNLTKKCVECEGKPMPSMKVQCKTWEKASTRQSEKFIQKKEETLS